MTARVIHGNEGWVEAAAVIRGGGLVVFPTDTVYGVGCHAYNPQAILRIYAAKGRSQLKAIPLLLSDAAAMWQVASSVPPCAQVLAARFWPGGLSIVVPKTSELPAELSPGDTVAVRVPDLLPLCSLIRAAGGAIAATSANISGDHDALDAESAFRYLGEDVDLLVDGGPSPGGVPSSVVDCSGSQPRLLRAGAVSDTDIVAALRAKTPRER